MALFVDGEMGKNMKGKWDVIIHCNDPVRCRKMKPIVALSEDQATMMAEKMASKMFGKKGDGWNRVEIQESTT